ncbi:UNVERIFIED_CONTAM: hypothetical protein GTU68_040908 [Idotea baltica]|nr:hypothetical protein [Idotea baltica]
MLPIAAKLDQVGFWSLESWGGATFDSCIRYLGEDPWERLRQLKKAMPNTRQQMLLRGQNLLGYRHYADDVVDAFIERAAVNGIDVFRVFDAMNDPRNLESALKSIKKQGKHAQGAISYTTSPVHQLDGWISLAKTIETMGADSLAIKDMAGILTPFKAYELVSCLKNELSIPIHLHCHATAGLSTATILKAVEAGVDVVDTAISSLSMTYGHSPTESVVAIFQDSNYDTGLDMNLLEEIADYFRQIRKKYIQFEGSLKGIDSRILLAQVPGGMLTNMEQQLKEQSAFDKFDQVLTEIPKVREDLGFIPLVTPTSQIVGTQAVLNVLTGERYKSITKETAGILKGEYGAAPAAFNEKLLEKVLDGKPAMTCRPADKLVNEMQSLTKDLKEHAKVKKITLADNVIEDVLTYALFQQIGFKFLQNRDNPAEFEPIPSTENHSIPKKIHNSSVYTVNVEGASYIVEVNEGGEITAMESLAKDKNTVAQPSANLSNDIVIQNAPLTGNIFKVLISEGDMVQEGDILFILEAMKMETEIQAINSGIVKSIHVVVGDNIALNEPLITLIKES